MRWPFRKARRAQAAPHPTEATVTAAPPQVHPSPVLEALLDRLEDAAHIVDLGTAVGSNIDILSGSTGRLQVIDLYNALESAGVLDTTGIVEIESVLQEILPGDPGTVDAVLAWDLFDHLKREPIRALAARLRHLARPGGSLYAIVSLRDQIPATPQSFKIIDRETLEYRPRSAATTPGPRHPPSEIEGILVGFTIVKTVLLRHGVREYLAVRKP